MSNVQKKKADSKSGHTSTETAVLFQIPKKSLNVQWYIIREHQHDEEIPINKIYYVLSHISNASYSSEQFDTPAGKYRRLLN
jgi:hypothetical protein